MVGVVNAVKSESCGVAMTGSILSNMLVPRSVSDRDCDSRSMGRQLHLNMI